MGEFRDGITNLRIALHRTSAELDHTTVVKISDDQFSTLIRVLALDLKARALFDGLVRQASLELLLEDEHA